MVVVVVVVVVVVSADIRRGGSKKLVCQSNVRVAHLVYHRGGGGGDRDRCRPLPLTPTILGGETGRDSFVVAAIHLIMSPRFCARYPRKLHACARVF